MLAMTNKRTDHGLQLLVRDTRLAQLAGHALEVLERDLFFVFVCFGIDR